MSEFVPKIQCRMFSLLLSSLVRFSKGSSRILVASVQNGGFFEASTPASNGSPKSSLGGATFVETARTIGALSTGISLPNLRPRRA